MAGWILVLANAVSLLTSCLTLSNAQVDGVLAQNHLPVEAQKLIGIVGRGGALAIGVLLLEGVPWGRWLYAVWGAVARLDRQQTKFGFVPGPLWIPEARGGAFGDHVEPVLPGALDHGAEPRHSPIPGTVLLDVRDTRD